MSYATVAGVGSNVELGLVDFLAAIDPLRQRRVELFSADASLTRAASSFG